MSFIITSTSGGFSTFKACPPLFSALLLPLELGSEYIRGLGYYYLLSY